MLSKYSKYIKVIFCSLIRNTCNYFTCSFLHEIVNSRVLKQLTAQHEIFFFLTFAGIWFCKLTISRNLPASRFWNLRFRLNAFWRDSAFWGYTLSNELTKDNSLIWKTQNLCLNNLKSSLFNLNSTNSTAHDFFWASPFQSRDRSLE